VLLLNLVVIDIVCERTKKKSIERWKRQEMMTTTTRSDDDDNGSYSQPPPTEPSSYSRSMHTPYILQYQH
jgi:hypothetical protein